MSEPPEFDSARPELPRLRIHHLLALTAIFSLVMAIDKGFQHYHQSQGAIVGVDNWISAYISLIRLSTSTCIVAVLFGFAWQKRGLSFPSQPGHWVALYLTLAYAFDLGEGIVLVFLVVPLDNTEWITWLMMAMSIIFHGLAATLWGFAFRSELVRIWKWGWAAMILRSVSVISLFLIYFLAKGVEWLLEVFWYNHSLDWPPFSILGSIVGVWIFQLPNYAILMFVPAAMFSDFRQHRLRHWSHWMVLILICVMSFTGIVFHLAN